MSRAHVVGVTVFVSIVTVPVRASSRPATLVPAPTVIDSDASMLPLKAVFAPRVDEVPICQNV